jgi:hypothetical protein
MMFNKCIYPPLAFAPLFRVSHMDIVSFVPGRHFSEIFFSRINSFICSNAPVFSPFIILVRDFDVGDRHEGWKRRPSDEAQM